MSAVTDEKPIMLIRPNKGLFDFNLGEVWQYRELLYFLVWRDLKVRYSQAALGAAWAIIQPLVAVAIFTVIFGVFANLPSDGIPYAVFAFAAKPVFVLVSTFGSSWVMQSARPCPRRISRSLW
jgi:lipopolysaccharide transport system permease protein